MNNNFNEFRKIWELQKVFEGGYVKESDISCKDKNKLLDLYNSQIQTLKIDVNMKQKELNKITEWVNQKYEMAIEKKLTVN